jgi:hypothetical protein
MTASYEIGRARVMRLSQNYDPTQNRATASEEGPTWVAPTSYVGVAMRQEVYSRPYTAFGPFAHQANKKISLLCLRHRDV